MLAFVDHGPDGVGGEVLAGLLRPGNANANSAADHVTVLDMALAQLPGAVRSRVVVRADSGGGTKTFLTRITNLGLDYSIGIGTTIGVDQQLLTRLPRTAWTQAYDPDGKPREGAQVTELTGMLPWLTGGVGLVGGHHDEGVGGIDSGLPVAGADVVGVRVAMAQDRALVLSTAPSLFPDHGILCA